MPGGTIDNLEIEISATSAQAEAKINGLVRSLNTLKSTLGSGTASGIKDLSESLKSLRAALNFSVPQKITRTLTEFSEALKKLDNTAVIKFGQAMKSLEGLGEIKLSKSIPDTIRELGIAVKDINTAELQVFGDTMKGLAGIEKIKLNKNLPETISELAKAVDEISDHALARLNSVTEALGRLQGVDLGVARAATRMKPSDAGRAAEAGTGQNVGSEAESATPKVRAFAAAMREMWEEFKNEPLVRAISGGFKQLAKDVGNVAKKMLQLAGQGIKKVFTNMGDSIKNTTSKLTGLGRAFGRIALYRALRTAIKMITEAFSQGVNAVYEYSEALDGVGANGFAKNMDSAASSIQYFKDSIGAAVAPILNALIPALNAVIDKIVEAINWINQFFARLSGAGGWTRAKRAAAEFGNEAKKAGGAAKEALKYLAPFDELNVLPDDKSGGGGGASDAENYLDRFEEVAGFDSPFAKIADNIREAIKRGDWYGAGTALADGLNGLIKQIDTFSFGKKLGEKIQQGLSFALGFMRNFDFNQVGAKIADALNGIMESVNFEDAGALYIRIKTFLIDGLIGFLQKLNWKNLGKSIGDFFRGALKEATEWIKKYDWKQMGENLWQDIKDAIEGIDFDSLANSLFTFLGTAVRAAVDVIGGFFHGVWEDVCEYFRKKMEEAGGDTWKGFWKGVSDAWASVTTWVKEHIVDPFLNAFKNPLGIHSPSTVFEGFGKDIIDGLKNGIENAWKGLKTFFEGKLQELKNIWANFKLPANTVFETTANSSGHTFSGGGRAFDKVGKLIGASGTFATGGFPEDGLFWANHNELVGRFSNGKTAVANNDQIVAGISAGVEDANESVVTAIYSAATQMVNAIRESGGGSDVDWNYVAQRVSRAQRSNARAMGTA